MLTITELEQLQSEHPEWQMELVDGSIHVMGPSDYESEEIIAELIRLLGNWVRPQKLGRVTGSSAGFILPSLDGALYGNIKRNLRAPDVSYVRADRLKRTKRDFVELVPDLMVEVKSKSQSPSLREASLPEASPTPTDTLCERLKPLQEKIDLFLQLGSAVGILIDPDELTLTVYRLNQEPVILHNGDRLTLPDLLPGWELTVSELWPPVFE